MTEERGEFSLDGVARLQSAAKEFARTEIARIVEAVIAELRSRPAVGIFGDGVFARHMWDEYCWALQEGPFDVNFGYGSVSSAWEDTVSGFVDAEVEKLPKHALVFLSKHVRDEDDDSTEGGLVGGIWVDGIVAAIMEEICERASRPKLELIGPHRGDVIGYEIEGYGIVWSALSDRGEALGIVASHVDAMIDPDANLSELASELVETFMDAAKEEANGTILAEFLKNFADSIRDVLTQNDVLPTLERMRGELLKRLDK